MQNLPFFLRLSRWARHPPSRRRVQLFLGVVAACLVLYAIDRLVGWPEWLTPENTPRGRITK